MADHNESRDAALGRAIRECLEAELAALERYDLLVEAKKRELRAAGYRLVTHDRDSEDNWRVTDYATGEILATGSGPDAYEAFMSANLSLWSTGTIPDHVFDEAESSDVDLFPEFSPEVPPALGSAISDWVGSNRDAAVAWLRG